MSDLPPSPPPGTPPSPPPPPRPTGPPEYKVYRSRKRLSDRFGPLAGNPLEALRRKRGKDRPPLPGEKPPKPTWRRVLKWVAIAVGAWILIAIVAFFISAQTAPTVSDQTKQTLSGGGSVLTGSNVLVLGSDQRVKGTKEPGASTSGPSRSDSIMVIHVGVGSVRKLSILRDTRVDIPGHGSDRINAAYAFGGAPLTIKTVQGFLPGVKINHIILVSFTNFPKLIDALGGVDITLKKCVSSNSFGGKRVRLTKGEHHLNGQQALRFARVRKNRCSPNEDDRARAARQQQVLAAMRDKVASPTNWPSTFIRGPFVAWEAPRAFKSDMHGPGLSALFIDLLTGGSGATDVLKPDPGQPFINGMVNVTEAERTDAAKKLLGK
jgi:LCP family protein required for cell wall assembly